METFILEWKCFIFQKFANTCIELTTGYDIHIYDDRGQGLRKYCLTEKQ